MNQRRKIQQPLSLFLQLLGIALLLLAIAQLKWGDREQNQRDHVLVLDASAWMGARGPSGALLIQTAKSQALAWLKTVPSEDRVMVLRADASATPATRFERNRETIETAIRETQPGASALRLDQALRFAAQFQKLNSQANGEIVYVGPGRTSTPDAAPVIPANLRVLGLKGPTENVGLRRMGLRRSATEADAWEILVTVRNYGLSAQNVALGLQFAGSPAGSKTLALKPASEQETTFTYRTRAAGLVEAKLLANDAFPQDDRAVLELPQQKNLRVVVYTNEPDLLRPVLTANPNLTAVFEPPSAYRPDPAGTDIVLFDRFAPPQPPKVDAIWIEPPPSQSPVAVASTKAAAKLSRWTDDPLLGAGLRTRDLTIDSTLTFKPAAGDIVIAESDGAPLMIARPAKPKIAVLGFHPVRSRMKYELATPLLFANTLRWMAPESFRRWQLNGGHVGSVSVKAEGRLNPQTVRVMDENGGAVPFTVDGDNVRFFAGSPGTIRVLTGDRDYVYSLTVPEVGESVWEVPEGVRKGVPRRLPGGPASRDLWYWLALAALAVFATEWFLFGRHRMRVRAAGVAAMPSSPPQRKAS